MFHLGKQLAMCRAVASQLVGHNRPQHILKTFQQPAKESFGRVAISPWLNEDVEHRAVLESIRMSGGTDTDGGGQR